MLLSNFRTEGMKSFVAVSICDIEHYLWKFFWKVAFLYKRYTFVHVCVCVHMCVETVHISFMYVYSTVLCIYLFIQALAD